MAAKGRTDLLSTTEMFHLDVACRVIHEAFGHPPYLVGSAGIVNDGSDYRDVDVRLILPDDEFAAVCPTRERWQALSLAFTAYLTERTGLPIDFQVQRATEANERYPANRNPLGMRRTFAGGGDATPDWGAA